MNICKACRLTLLATALATAATASAQSQSFPDGTPIPEWFAQRAETPDTAGRRFVITDHGVTATDSTLLQTERIQRVIDMAAERGGGVVVMPRGVFLSGALFFAPGTHLHLESGAVLKGSDDISHFPVVDTRIEGRTVRYFAALVNADRCDGFSISGSGTINGNGLRYWRSFWLRRAVIPKCTNMDELRPRLVYVSRSNDVVIQGVTLRDSPFWTTHFYRCSRLRMEGLTITSPFEPVKAPSTDAIDLDACTMVHISNCYMSVNDDAIALKGGKGPWADTDTTNGANRDIIVEDCRYGRCHSMMTCGSESVHSRNIIVRRCHTDGARCVLTLKMRPDTPQKYEYIDISHIEGNVDRMVNVAPWTQFYDLQGRPDRPMSYARHISLHHISLRCSMFLNMRTSDDYRLSDISLRHIEAEAETVGQYDAEAMGMSLEGVTVNGRTL